MAQPVRQENFLRDFQNIADRLSAIERYFVTGVPILVGRTINIKTETQISASPASMPTPDKVANITVEENDVLVVLFRALVAATNGAGVVALTTRNIDSGIESIVATPGGLGIVTADPYAGSFGTFKTVFTDSTAGGDVGLSESSGSDQMGSGQHMGTPLYIMLNPGNYDIEVMYTNNSGPSPGVSAKSRRLYVWKLTDL